MRALCLLTQVVLVLQEAEDLMAQLGGDVVVRHVGPQEPELAGLILLDLRKRAGKRGDRAN